MKSGFGKLASLSEAFEIIEGIVKPMQAETVPIENANGRVLAEDVVSQIDVPHFRKSAMDGFAVIAEDTYGASNTNPKRLEVIESVTAGVISKNDISSGECIEITTGAPLPDSADAVLMVEHTEKEGSSISYYKTCAPGENVIKIGSDMKKDDLIVQIGTLLNPRNLGSIASAGILSLNVSKVPRISYFSTGNEILTTGELEPGKVFDINSRTIVDTLREHGCHVNFMGVVKDDLKQIKDTIKRGLDSDLLLLSGGSSLGGEDFMVEAVRDMGKVHVHGIASKPGKPVLIGEINGKLILGLPGYPTSALSNTYSLVLPVIYWMMGGELVRKTAKARLSRKIASTIGRFEFLPVRLDDDIAIPVMKGSSSISTLSLADGYITIDENTEVVNKDDIVEVYYF